jgi:sugar phosphate isomerase/epimerase
MQYATLGAHTFGFVWQSDVTAAVEAIAQAGFRGIQIMATPPHFDPWRVDLERTRRLRAIIDRAGLELLALDLASSDINLASPSDDVVAFAVDAYERAIERAAELGARWVCVASGRRHPLVPEANARLRDTYERAFARIHEYAGRRGVGVILENHPQGLLPTASSMIGFLDRAGFTDVPVIYDVANALAADEDPVAGFAQLRDRVSILHLSDTPTGQWRHDPIGSGNVDFEGLGRAVSAHAFAGQIVLEILAPDALGHLTQGVERLRALGWVFDGHPASR